VKAFVRVIILVILITSIGTLGKDIFGQLKKFDEIRQVESESNNLAAENQLLKENQKNENAEFSLEKQARDKLNYKKEGETLYVVELQDKDEKLLADREENWKEWYELFFK